MAATEPDDERRRAVLEFLVDLCDRAGWLERSRPIPGTTMPAFAAAVPGHGVVVVWVIATNHQQLAIRYLYDTRRDVRFGG